jgi:tetratricopeptide (TPR) repeat protein
MQARFISPLHGLLFRFARNAAGALMAKAAYEPLEREEKNRLDCLCRKYPELAAEQEKFVAFAAKFHPATEELPFDLSGRIAAALAETSEPRQRYATIYVTAIAVLVLAVSVYLVSMFGGAKNAPVPGSSDIQMASVPSPFDELAASMQQAKVLEDKGDYLGAVGLLEGAIAKAPESPIKGDPLQRLADIEYTCLQRYEKAFVAYDALRENYPDIFAANRDSQDRYDLLAELRNESYWPLYKIDNARSRNADVFSVYEDVVALYPDTTFARVAVDEMSKFLKSEMQKEQMTRVDELNMVRERCCNPTVVAKVDLMLGHHYQDIIKDREQAKVCYTRVAASDHVALANQAIKALSVME